jgi:hypothetical protein
MSEKGLYAYGIHRLYNCISMTRLLSMLVFIIIKLFPLEYSSVCDVDDDDGVDRVNVKVEVTT